QIGSVKIGLEIPRPGGGAPPLPARQIPVAHAVHLGPIEVRITGDAEAFRSSDEGIRERILPARQLHPERTVATMVVVGAAVIPLILAVIREDVLEPPPGRPQPLPGIVVEWRSEEHTSELQSRENLVCRLLLEKKKQH